MNHQQYDEHISARSHLLWERDGRPPGLEREYWQRARAELDAELLIALEGRETGFVPTHPVISRRPIRYSA